MERTKTGVKGGREFGYVKKKKKWGGLAGSFTINVLWSRKIQNHNQRERKDGTWRESLVGSKSFL